MISKRVLIALFFVGFFAFLGVVSAADIEVEEIDRGSIVISEINNPALFDFIITNNGEQANNIEIFSLVGVKFSPRGTFNLEKGKTIVPVKVYLGETLLKNRGFVSFEYQINSRDSGLFKRDLLVKIISIDEVFEIKSGNLKFEDDSAVIFIRNVQNTGLEDVTMHLKSAFFDETLVVDFGPFEEKEIPVVIDLEKTRNLVAGPYFIEADISIDGEGAEVSGIINYLEKENLFLEEKSSGFIVREKSFLRRNEGNKPVVVNIETKKDVITRLFTVFSEEPRNVERSGFFVNYEWFKEIDPGKTYEVVITTNYTFPVILIVLVVLIAFFARIYSLTSVKLDKKVNFVKTKGGEFALRVRLRVKAGKDVDSVQVIDNLPGMTKLYESFGRKPDKIDEKSRRIFWDLGNMNAGEERIISYIIYSKVRAVGRFELPSATVVYGIDGRTEEVFSNRAFFVSDTVEED
ncbi:hypothetical protein CMI45_01880 [Candidatus Pacearchaeota archaeon]|nr:hypothetical protein [Candidatus Pacearchaeota archaeon]|tara:strand:- start:22 stop:1407 length:1386 start_codon:yes stop_codon:yes gene_type:complete